jgi:O-antigen biosynthesis protein WbqV
MWRPLRLTSSKSKLPVLVLGQDVEAESFLRYCLEGAGTQFSPICILSRTSKFSGHFILDVQFFETIDKLETVLENLAQNNIHPHRLIITDLQTFDALKTSSIDFVEIASRYQIVTSRVETDPKDINTKASVNVLPANVEDLLFRPVSPPIGLKERKLLEGTRVLVTGGGGLIGTELCRQIIRANPSELMIIDMSEFNLYTVERELGGGVDLKLAYCNIKERERVFQIFRDFKPEFVFHATALKHVPIVEANKSEGVLTSILGTKNVADACVEFEVKGCILISTDKAVDPTNFMGCAKRIAEMYYEPLNAKSSKNKPSTRFVSVRFGNVFGSSGSVIPLFKKQIEMGGPVTITHPDMRRSFMTIPKTVSLVLKAFYHGYRKQIALIIHFSF